MTWLETLIGLFRQAPPPAVDLEAAGRVALAEAERLWGLDIYDAPANDNSEAGKRSKALISEILTACGWAWAAPYKGDRIGPEWCGLTVGACWRKAGLDLDIARTFFPSTYRLLCYANYRPFDAKHKNERPPNGPYRLIMNLDAASVASALPWQPRAGDIVIMGPGSDQHIEMWDRLEGDVVHTVGGNAGGVDPSGNKQQGVVRAKRAIGIRGMRELGTTWHVRHVIRVAPGDLR